MSEWTLAAAILSAALVPCLLVCALSAPGDGLVALELSGTLLTTVLMVLAEGTRRQPFIDLALICGLVSMVGALAFARLLEHDL